VIRDKYPRLKYRKGVVVNLKRISGVRYNIK